MTPLLIAPDQLAGILPKGGRVLVGACSAESLLLADAVMGAGGDLGAMTFTGIFIPGVNRRTYLANPECRVETFFLTPELKAAGAGVRFLPIGYGDILARLRAIPIDAALFMANSPDADGWCGFGPVADFLVELWPRIPVRVAHLNPRLPRVASSHRIRFDDLTAYMEGEQELVSFADGGDDKLSMAVGAHVAPFVPDGSTIQTGLGRIPTAALRALRHRRGLKLHTGLIPDAVCDLEDAGALAPGVAITGGVAIGSQRLYDRVGGPAYRFESVLVTHAPRVWAGIDKPVAINSALEVDLFGQVYSELGPSGLMSGPGGAADFSRGVWAAGGLRIIMLASSAAKGAVSRIVAPSEASGLVSLGRFDTDIVVTEHGAADLRGLDHDGRAGKLIAIAPPDHRERLETRWREIKQRF